MGMKKIAVGESDFKKIITGDYYYVDKSLFIKEIIDRGDTVILIPRPRRFGKTLKFSPRSEEAGILGAPIIPLQGTVADRWHEVPSWVGAATESGLCARPLTISFSK